MSYSQDPKEGYTKLANIKQGGGQHVEIYVPDTRRKMSPEAQARALARSEIKEQYKAAALAEEVKAIKKQRNKLVDNLAKVGKSPSFVADIPPVDGLSGTPKTYVDTPTSPTTTTTASTPSKSKSQVGNLNYQVGNLNYSAPIGPLPSSSMGGFKNKPYDNRINYSQPIGPTQGPGLGMSFNRNRNYSAPIGPLPSSSMGGFQDRPYNPQMNYSQPIGPTQGPGLGMSFNRSRNYSAPIGPAPSSSMGGFQGRPFNQQTNYSQPIGPTQGPGLGMSFNRNRNYSAPIGPAPSSSMGGFQGRPFNQQTNYSQPIGPTQGPGLGMSFNRNRNYSAPIGPAPGPDMGGFQDRPYDQQINYSQPIGPRGAPNNRRMSGRTPSSSGRMVEYQGGDEPIDGGRNQQGNYNDYVDDGDQPRRSGLPSSGRVVEYKDDAKTGSVSQQDTSKWTPEMLLPGKTLAEVEAVYKQRKASAVKKRRTKLARALDRAIVIRRKQFGASGKIPQTTPGRTPDRSPTGQTPLPTDVEKNAELLLPGKTEQAVRRVHAERRAAAMKKGNKELVARLDRALPVRLQRLKSQGANVFKVSPERLLPGKTLAEVEAAYKQRRAAAGAKGRTSLVKALDRAIVERRKQFGASPGKTPQTTPVKSPTGKTPLPSDVERNAERLLPGKTEQAVRKVHAERRAAAAKKGNKELVARLDRALPVRLQRLKSQGANVFKVSPERLLPGKTLPEVEAAYKQRRASAVSKGRTALVQALDRAIAVRRKQLGGSPGKSPQATPVKSPTGKTPLPSDGERDAERLLPGKTEQAVRKIHAERRAAAMKKGDKELTARLDRALPVRLQRLKSQGANVFKVSPERLLPGKTLPEVEAAYKQRRASAVSKGRTALVQALDRAIAARRKQLGGSPGKTPQATPGKSPSNLSKIPPERLIPGKNLAEVEATYKTRRASAVAKKRIALVQALDRAIGIRRKQFGGPSGQVPSSPGKVPSSPSKTPLPSGKEWKDVFGPVDMSNPNPRAVSEKYQALRRRTKDEDVSKLNALFKKAIIDIKLIKRQRAAQESKSAEGAKAKMEADKARVEAEKAKAKSAEVKKSIDREIISTKRKIRDVSIKAKKASANIDRAGKEMSAATARRDTRKVEKLTRFSRKRQQNLRSAQEVRGKLITSLKGLEQKSAKVSPLMLTQGSQNPMARQSAQQQSIQQQKSSQIQAKAQSFLAEKARAQSAKIQQSGKQMVIKAAQDKMQSAKAQSAKAQSAKAQSAKAQSAKLEQERRQKSVLAEKAKAQSAKLEQEKRQKSAKIEQEKRLQLAKAQSAKAQSAKMEQIKKAQTSQKRQMSQARPPMKVMRPRRR
jgi:hypothetical protein